MSRKSVPCVTCGTTFLPPIRRILNCSLACSSQYNKKMTQVYNKAYKTKHAATLKPKVRAALDAQIEVRRIARETRTTGRIRICKHCPNEIPNKHDNAKVCSDACLKAAKQRRAEQFRHENREELLAKEALWRETNRESKNESNRKWKKNNPHKINADASMRRAALRGCVPRWFNDTHKEQIEWLFKRRKKGYHVDHIVPLRHPLVSGLHVPWNLRVISATENLKKSNKLLQELWSMPHGTAGI